MDRKTKKQIWNETNLTSMKRGGNEIFRVGVTPFESEMSLPKNVYKTISVRPGKFTGSFYYKLNRSVVIQGFFWKHNGPTADLYYFKLTMAKKADETKISCYSAEYDGAEFVCNAFESVSYSDFDYPLMGFDIYVKEIECKRYLHSKADFLTQITKLSNYVLSKMVGEKYFDNFEIKESLR